MEALADQHIQRHLAPRLIDALTGFRVVVLHGPRQSGKTTLARRIAEEAGGTYLTLEDAPTLHTALDDPVALLTSRPKPLVIDEVQTGGDRIIKTVKKLVDEEQEPGRFLLTGSTDFLSVPTISESLAGRARIMRLGPLSMAEISGLPRPVVENWLNDFENPTALRPALRPSTVTRATYAQLICNGGYPEVLRLPDHLRSGWFDSYVETVVERDIAALADVRRLTTMGPLLRWSAAMTSQELNIAATSRRLEISQPTAVRYLDWLRTVFLVHELPAWSRNLVARARRRPKLHLADTGIAANLLGASSEALLEPTSTAFGHLAESFVVGELSRQTAAASTRITMWHYRDSRHEVDMILERPDGGVVAVEVKASSSPAPSTAGHLIWLRDRLDQTSPGLFLGGIVLHMGEHDLKIGDRIHMRPISSLWS